MFQFQSFLRYYFLCRASSKAPPLLLHSSHIMATSSASPNGKHCQAAIETVELYLVNAAKCSAWSYPVHVQREIANATMKAECDKLVLLPLRNHYGCPDICRLFEMHGLANTFEFISLFADACTDQHRGFAIVHFTQAMYARQSLLIFQSDSEFLRGPASRPTPSHLANQITWRSPSQGFTPPSYWRQRISPLAGLEERQVECTDVPLTLEDIPALQSE